LAQRVWRYNYGLGTIYAELDKSKTSMMDIIQKAFAIAENFGFISRIEVTTESNGDDAFVENYNIQETEAFKPIDQLHITTKAPTEEFLTFINKHPDVRKLYFTLSTTGIDEYGQTVLIGGGVELVIYLEPDEEWGMNIFINTDIFVPLSRVKDARTEAMAETNAPVLKRLLENCLTHFPVTEWEWLDTLYYTETYLNLSIK
jgi:cold shock CspA family protein